MKSTSHQMLALATGIFFGVCPAFASGQTPYSTSTFVNASSSISSLTYQLIDLTPNDGVAPSIIFSPGAMGYEHQVSINGNDTKFPTIDQLIVNNPNTLLSVSGIASGFIGADQIESKIAISESDFVNNAKLIQEGEPFYVPGKNFTLEESSLVSVAGSDISYGLGRVEWRVDPQSSSGYTYYLTGDAAEDVPYFTLSPNTEMRISGQMNSQLSVNYDELTQINADQTKLVTFASSGILSHFFDPVDGSTSWETPEAFEQAINLSRENLSDFFDKNVCAEPCISNSSNQKAFNLILSNASTTSKRGRIMASTNAFLRFNSAPIPEPSTYALMALGLLGVSAAVRRRK